MTLDEFTAYKWLEERFYREALWKYRLSLLPRRCYVSKRWLWGRHFRLSRVYGGVGGVFEEARWLHRETAMQFKLSQDVLL